MKETPYGHCLYGVKLSVEETGEDAFAAFGFEFGGPALHCQQLGFEFSDLGVTFSDLMHFIAVLAA